MKIEVSKEWFQSRAHLEEGHEIGAGMPGLYQIKAETETAILARAAGIRAAQEALGHTTPETTERHYLS